MWLTYVLFVKIIQFILITLNKHKNIAKRVGPFCYADNQKLIVGYYLTFKSISKL